MGARKRLSWKYVKWKLQQDADPPRIPRFWVPEFISKHGFTWSSVVAEPHTDFRKMFLTHNAGYFLLNHHFFGSSWNLRCNPGTEGLVEFWAMIISKMFLLFKKTSSISQWGIGDSGSIQTTIFFCKVMVGASNCKSIFYYNSMVFAFGSHQTYSHGHRPRIARAKELTIKEHVQIPLVLRWKICAYVDYLFQSSYQNTNPLIVGGFEILQILGSYIKISTRTGQVLSSSISPRFAGVDTKMWALLRSQGANSVSCHMSDLILISHAISRL